MTIRNCLLAAALASLAGCGALLETPYRAPEVELPDAWEARGGSAASEGEADHWWQAFGDARLDSLIDRALARNADLALAAIRLERARMQAGLADTNLTPDASLGGQSSVSKALRHDNPSQREYGLTFQLGYELDLWGKLARTRDAAAWASEASRFDLDSARLSLIGATASTYWTIAELNARLADAQADIRDARRIEALVAARYRAGADGMAELALARRAMAGNEAAYEQLLQQREAQRRTLTTLLDEAVPLDEIAGFVLPDGPEPDVRPGLPASVLQARPDVAAAQARIRASLAAHDASKAGFFPTLSLTGTVGTAHRDLGHVLTNPIGTLGAGLALPFLQWNTVRLNVGISRTEYEESVVLYRKTLYQAFAEVSEALGQRESLLREAAPLLDARRAAQAAEKAGAARYRAGKQTIRFWLEDRQALRTAQAAVERNRLNRLRVRMMLYQALGGG
ncbi:efflux transporter outer membrane subunit [Cupriavidus agavae]|uniref:NodT family efflux transporter outer membrane factor (OMF) lipoprotein n=1 Tax=Cupriavidus agavae TaxID=1001822 RepID=A0A4Q7S7I7_9BURK|nr:efflux transporter outer membrane subunit [Cupriavidus agavae]RZT42381.1 NodT family efflux transporter outer membrane factor (OMF) lipoprotein [Cupriavidus agavae]